MSNNEEVPIRLALSAITQDCSNVCSNLILMMMGVVAVVINLEAIISALGNHLLKIQYCFY